MRKFALLGFPLSHSFSKQYFENKFAVEGIQDASYEFFELPSIELLGPILQQETDLVGFNVTIPYKQEVMAYLDEIESSAQKIGAVNVVKREGDKLVGYNSDYYGFMESIKPYVAGIKRALIFGTGGASKAVQVALADLGVEVQMVSRTAINAACTYKDLTEEIVSDHLLLVNTTPLGMSPNVGTCPDIPYEGITDKHVLFDLVYNPEETLFLKKGKQRGAASLNGHEMLVLQAEKSWQIWN